MVDGLPGQLEVLRKLVDTEVVTEVLDEPCFGEVRVAPRCSTSVGIGCGCLWHPAAGMPVASRRPIRKRPQKGSTASNWPFPNEETPENLATHQGFSVDLRGLEPLTP